MKNPCEPLEDLVQAQALPPDHPRRRHLDNCARCRARLLAMKDFQDDDSLLEGMDLEDADRRLSATVSSIRNGGNNRFRSSILTTGILAMAAVIAMVVFFPKQNAKDLVPGPGLVLRGTPAEDPFSLSVSTREDGGLDFSWSPITGAHNYRVVFFDASLVEIPAAIDVNDTFLSLPPQSEKPVFWKVTAMADKDPLVSSQLEALMP